MKKHHQKTIHLNERKLKWVNCFHSSITEDYENAKKKQHRFFGSYCPENDTFILYFRYLNNKKQNSGESLFCFHGKIAEEKGGITVTGYTERIWKVENKLRMFFTLLFSFILILMLLTQLQNEGIFSIIGLILVIVLFVFLQLKRKFDNAEAFLQHKIQEL